MTKPPEAIYDEFLVLRSQDGDEQAFDELVLRWQPRLWRHARQLTGSDDSAWEILQEAWMAIVRSLRQFDDPANFPKWAYRIVGNKCADWIRRQQRRRRFIKEAHHHAQQTHNDPVDMIQHREEMDGLRTALRTMPGERRAMLSMFYQEQMSTAEIAHALGIPVGTVKSRLYHAREQLKIQLERMKT